LKESKNQKIKIPTLVASNDDIFHGYTAKALRHNKTSQLIIHINCIIYHFKSISNKHTRDGLLCVQVGSNFKVFEHKTKIRI
jgi:hypothetical protein